MACPITWSDHNKRHTALLSTLYALNSGGRCRRTSLRSPVQILGDVSPPVIYARVRGSSRNVLLRRYCCAWSSARCDADVRPPRWLCAPPPAAAALAAPCKRRRAARDSPDTTTTTSKSLSLVVLSSRQSVAGPATYITQSGMFDGKSTFVASYISPMLPTPPPAAEAAAAGVTSACRQLLLHTAEKLCDSGRARP